MPPAQTTTATQQQQQQEKKRKGFFGKIAGFFKNDTTEGQDVPDDNKQPNTNSEPK
jgi:hypothetical protein